MNHMPQAERYLQRAMKAESELARLRSLNAELLAACEALENAVTFDEESDAKDGLIAVIAKAKEFKPRASPPV